jgi:DNA-binding Xre family transcriptional regulator
MAWLAGRPGRRVPAALAGTRGYAVESIGDVICGLDELLLVAAERWRTRLTQQDLARISGLSRSTINELLPRRVWAHALGGAATETEIIPYQGRVALHTIAALCSVFICLPGELLRYRAPGQSLSRLSPNAVRRDEIPPRRVNVYPLTNTIPERLQAYTPAGLEKAAGISWSRWNRVKAGTTQIDLPMLAAICAVLNTDVSGILAHSIPFRDSTWSVRFVRLPGALEAAAPGANRGARPLAPDPRSAGRALGRARRGNLSALVAQLMYVMSCCWTPTESLRAPGVPGARSAWKEHSLRPSGYLAAGTG